MKKEKIISFFIFSIFCIPISWVMAVFIHCTLKHIKFSIEMVTNINFEKGLILLFFLSFIFSIISLAIIFLLGNNSTMKSEVNKITNNIVTPKAVGQGQHGTSRWLTDKEFKKIYKYNVIKNEKPKRKWKWLNRIESKLYIKKVKLFGKNKNKCKSGGLVVGYERNKRFEKIYYIDDNIHSLVVGATRSGKSRCVVLETIGNLALAGESMIISDPKSELYHYTSGYLKDNGYKIVTLDFKNPLKSSRYNFLQPVIDAVNQNDYRKAEELSWDITQSLVGNEESKMEKIWKDGEMSVIAGAIMSVVFDNKQHPEYQNLTNVYTFISEMCKPVGNSMPINKYIETLKPEHPASNIFGVARIAPEKTRGSFFTSALATLRLFTSKSIYTMTCISDFKLSDAGKEKVATYIILPDEKTTYYSIASLFVYQNYVALVNLADENGGELPNRVNYILDEFGNFTTIPAFSNMLTVAGGRNIRFNIFLQSFAQLDNKYGKEIAENIRDNCQNWIYLKTASTETATIISKKLGNYTTSSYSRSSSYSRYSNSNSSESMNFISRALLTEDEIMRIERPYVLQCETGIYPRITKLPDISKWNFNRLYGMGNKEQNRKLREKRESERQERKDEDIKLWGIWNYFR
jgi:type IV secretion system protein VirD4